jgi:hypothetical protein
LLDGDELVREKSARAEPCADRDLCTTVFSGVHVVAVRREAHGPN